MRTDIIKVYKDVHIWVGIISGLALFIAFYAGAITMFEKPLERWATPPSTLAAAPALQDAPALVAATVAAHPQAADDYQIRVDTSADMPARMIWVERSGGGRRGPQNQFGSSFDGDGVLQVEKTVKSDLAKWVDILHQQVGLPFRHEVAMPIMGVIALMYALALISGVIVLLPTLIKDLFALRIGHNLKRMWLDAHNALGILSLPFHIVMALTAVVFAFHDQFYDVQEAAVYPQKIEWPADAAPVPPADAVVMTPLQLIAHAHEQAPDFEVLAVGYRSQDGVASARVEGVDLRYGMRGRISTNVAINPYTGELTPQQLPGQLTGWFTGVSSFFALHFGNFGGAPVRWAYFLLGLAGAMLFYTGNVLWLESRRKRQRAKGVVVQKRSARIMACLTVGVSLGCVAGISLTIAAAKWLPGMVGDVALWHRYVYYAAFFLATGWALWRGAGRAAVELSLSAALATALIPLSSVLGWFGVGGSWHHPGAAILIDLTALAGVVGLLLIARHSRRRALHGPADSVWAVTRTLRQPAPGMATANV